jgi:hypothetical protein
MNQKTLLKQTKQSLKLFSTYVLGPPSAADAQQVNFVFFDKYLTPYTVVAKDLNGLPSHLKLGNHVLHVYAVDTQYLHGQMESVAYMSIELNPSCAHLDMLQIKNKQFLRRGIAKNLLQLFEYIAHSNNIANAQGVAVQINKTIDIEQLKLFYEKFGYSTQKGSSGYSTFYKLNKNIDAQQMQALDMRFVNATCNKKQFKILMPKQFELTKSNPKKTNQSNFSVEQSI